MAQVYSDRDERHSSPADVGDDAEAEKHVTMPSAVGDGHPAEKPVDVENHSGPHLCEKHDKEEIPPVTHTGERTEDNFRQYIRSKKQRLCWQQLQEATSTAKTALAAATEAMQTATASDDSKTTEAAATAIAVATTTAAKAKTAAATFIHARQHAQEWLIWQNKARDRDAGWTDKEIDEWWAGYEDKDADEATPTITIEEINTAAITYEQAMQAGNNVVWQTWQYKARARDAGWSDKEIEEWCAGHEDKDTATIIASAETVTS